MKNCSVRFTVKVSISTACLILATYSDPLVSEGKKWRTTCTNSGKWSCKVKITALGPASKVYATWNKKKGAHKSTYIKTKISRKRRGLHLIFNPNKVHRLRFNLKPYKNIPHSIRVRLTIIQYTKHYNHTIPYFIEGPKNSLEQAVCAASREKTYICCTLFMLLRCLLQMTNLTI